MSATNEGNRFGIPGVPFPVGVEYYRAPMPKRDVWDADFARIRDAGFHIVRSFILLELDGTPTGAVRTG